MIRLIIFDFDGTLGDTRGNIILTMTQTLAQLGYPAQDEETMAATIGVPLEKGFEQMFPGIGPDEVALCAKTYREIFQKNRKQMIPKLFPHVKDTLAALQEAGYVLTIASSRSYGSLKEFLSEMAVNNIKFISCKFVKGSDNAYRESYIFSSLFFEDFSVCGKKVPFIFISF